VGLGNPGSRYQFTRHNVGFLLIDEVAQIVGIRLKKPVFKRFLIGESYLRGKRVILAKPLTYMNNSGEVFEDILGRANVSLSETVVVCDNLDLPVGSCRLKLKGSSGGHNGLKSIMANIGTGEFMRLYIGIGRPENKEEVISYVLGEPSQKELIELRECIKKAAENILMLLDSEPQRVMNVLNRRENG